MENCLLCLKLNNGSENGIQVNSTQWQELNIKNVIEKHLWPILTIQLSSWLCNTCWKELYSFHRFYIRIENSHTNFGLFTKIENHENQYEPKISIQEMILPEFIKQEDINTIKEEREKDLCENDKPLIPTNKGKRTENLNRDTTRHKAKKRKQTKARKSNEKESVTKLETQNEIPTDQQPVVNQSQTTNFNNTDKTSSIKNIKTHKSKNINVKKDKFLAENFKLECIVCQMPMQTFQLLCAHFEKEHDGQSGYVICCNKKFFERRYILDHVHQHLDPNYLKCKVCERVFTNRRYLTVHSRLHIRSTNKQTPIEQPQTTDTDNGEDISNDKIELNLNVNNTLDKDVFLAKNFKLECVICQMPMETLQKLCAHFKNEHDGQPGYVMCCNNKFFERCLLLDHVYQHLDPNYLKCKECGKLFTNRRYLTKHRSTHDPARSRNFCCDICGLSFTTPHNLICHKKAKHVSDEEKNFSCTHCDKKFGSKCLLKGHVRAVHTSPVNCDICGLTLVNGNALKRHKYNKHSDGETIEYTCSICSKISTNIYVHKNHMRNVHEMGYNYKCTLCDRAFKRPRALKEHIATHTGSPLYSCPWCPKTFNTGSNIAKHRKKYHPKEEENRIKHSGIVHIKKGN